MKTRTFLPRALRRPAVATVVTALALLASSGFLVTPSAAEAVPTRAVISAATPSDLAQARARILSDTNAARAAEGLAPLVEDADLDAVSQSCSSTQADANVMAHCPGFASRYPSGWTWAGENVAMGYQTDSVVTGWMNSPGHRANILRADATHIGIGFARASDGTRYFTQNFASYPNRPRATCADAPAAPSGAKPVYRFWSAVYQGHFYTIDRAERDMVSSTWPNVWRCEGAAYYAFTSPQPGTVPLFRFWSAQYNGHFYTVDPAERDAVVARWSSVWTYEGAVYHVYPPGSATGASDAVYRFWSASARHHFYTANAAERDSVIATWPTVWAYESEVFRVPR